MIDSSVELYGKFKFEVYNQDGSLDYSSEKGNFITPTGLSYINDYAIADCFRYISVGTGTGQNTILNGGTTGLQFPLTGSGYAYIGGSQVTQCSNKRGNQYFPPFCYTSTESSGLKLARGWRIPSTGFFLQDYDLNEFMVSPGTPIRIGYFNGLTGICHCNQQIYVSPTELGEVIAGVESIDFYSSYPNICRADKAFSRVIQSLPVKQNQYVLAQYFVLVSVDSGVKSFYLPSHRDNPFDGETGEGRENWNGSSGIYNVVCYGLKRINSGNASSYANQMHSTYEFRVGESYIPDVGIGLEPSCPLELRTGFITSDNTQFFVSETGYSASNDMTTRRIDQLPSGTFYFNPNLGDGLDNAFRRIRRPFAYPDPNDFNKAVTSYPISNESLSSLTTVNSGISKSFIKVDSSGRSRYQILTFQFAEPSLPARFPVRSFTMGYKNWKDTTIEDGGNYYPILDMIFSPRNASGQFFKNPSDLGYTITSGGYNTGVFFPTGFNSVFTPYIYQQQNTTINSETIISTGYWLWVAPHNRSFDLTYPVPPGNGDCFIVEEAMLDSRLTGNVKMTGYAIPQSVASTGSCSGLYWFGNIPTGAIKFDVNLSVRSLEHPNYGGGIAPYVTIGSYLIDSLSNVPTGSGDMRVFFTGSLNGLVKTPYIGRVAFRNPAQLDVQTDLTGYIGNYSYINEFRQYNVPVGMAMKQNNIFTGGYSYFDENNILLMQFKLGWNSPCPSGVLGC